MSWWASEQNVRWTDGRMEWSGYPLDCYAWNMLAVDWNPNVWTDDHSMLCWLGLKSQSHLEICFFSSQQRNAHPLKTQRLFLSIWLTFGTLMTWGLIHTVRYTHLWFCLHFSRCSFCVQTSWVYVVFTFLCSCFSKCMLCIFTCIHHFTFAVVGKGKYLCVRMRFRFVYLCYYVSELFVL